MRIRYTMTRLLCSLGLVLAVWACPQGSFAVQAQSKTYYVQLIRGTDQAGPQETSWKPIGPKLSNRLAPIFRWKKYWEVNRQPISVDFGKTSRSRLSDVRQVEIEMINPSELEIRLFVKGKLTQTSRQLTHTPMTIIGGDRTRDESWFVIVRRDKPQ